MLSILDKYQPSDTGYYPNDNMPIESRPKDYVDALGFSQKDFCQLLDVKTGIYSAWENGNYLIDPFIATKISNDFNIPMDFIYGGKKDNLPTKLRDYLFN